jgi:LuxR family maltose regulon positive regulatory protein
MPHGAWYELRCVSGLGIQPIPEYVPRLLQVGQKHMARRMPTIHNGALVDDCVVDSIGAPVRVGTAAWFSWLETADSFAFVDACGRLIARKEQRSHGAYWYGQSHHAGRVTTIYLGKSEHLTCERLRSAMQALARKAGRSLVQAPDGLVDQGESMGGSRDVTHLHLLPQKNAVPLAQPTLIPRSHAIELLGQVERSPLTLISAPVGSGKTTLLAQWVAAARVPVAWVSLDESDNDPARFWGYILAALEGRAPGIREAAGSARHAAHLPLCGQQLAVLLDKLATATSPIFLVLDDYHVIREDNSAIHRSMGFLVEHLPTHVHLLVSCRADPPLPLARLRARGLLAEIRTADLRFTLEEAAAFLTQRMEAPLQPDEITTLYDRTEGWITGLHLAELSARGREDDPQRIAAFNGGSRYVFEFLTDEVFDRLPSDVQAFLIDTGALDRLNGALCDAVTGLHGSQALLNTLARANLFLVPLDDQGQWYRYHHLFADALRLHLHQSHSDRVPELCIRASRWYEQHGQVVEAVEYALRAADFERAAGLIETTGEGMLADGREAMLRRWLDQLPEGVLHARPHLCMLYARLVLITGELAALERRVHDAEESYRGASRRLNRTERAHLHGALLMLRASIAVLNADFRRCDELCEQASATEPTERGYRYYTLMTQGLRYWLDGAVPKAVQVLEDVRCQGQTQSNDDLMIKSTVYLAYMHLLRGHLQEALELCLHARGASVARGASADGRDIDVVLGMVLYKRNDLEAAAEHLERGIERGASILALTCGYPTLAYLRHAQGDSAGAARLIERALTEACGAGERIWMAALIRAHQARLWLMQGNLEAAAGWAYRRERRDGAAGNAEGRCPAYVRECERIVFAQVYLAQGKTSEAMRVLSQELEAADAGGRVDQVLEILLPQAKAYAAQGDTSAALAVLRRAIALAEPEQYVRVFVDGGAPIRRLLALHQFAETRQRGAMASERASTAVGTLLAAFREDGHNKAAAAAVPATPARQQNKQPLIEPLTQREIEVLSLLAAGASNKDIARELVLATGTAKRHVSNIFSKLGVRSRTQAISRASMLQLIAPQQAYARTSSAFGQRAAM